MLHLDTRIYGINAFYNLLLDRRTCISNNLVVNRFRDAIRNISDSLVIYSFFQAIFSLI